MTAFEPSGGVVLRSPVLPLSVVTNLSADLSGDAAADLATVAARLRALVADPVVREAIFLASPSLDERLDPWLAGAEGDGRTTRSVLSYVTRMASRCTPFGLFAGCAPGTIGVGESRFVLGGRTALKRHTRLDFEYLARLVADLERGDHTRAALRFVPNTSLYSAGGRLRLAEGDHSGGVLRYRRVAIEEDAYLTATLARARAGLTRRELAAALVDEDISPDEALAYVTELVDGQVLVSDLGPAVTGDEPTRRLAAQLEAAPETRPVGLVLAAAQRHLDLLDAGGVGQPPQAFRAIATALEAAGTRVERARLFQADVVLGDSTVHLGEPIEESLRRAVGALHRLHPALSTDRELDRFTTAFAARYEGAEVSLLEALDEEVGVGLGSMRSSADGQPLLPGPVAPGGREAGPRVTAQELVLLEMVGDAAHEGRTTLDLDDDALQRLGGPEPPPMPAAFAVHATLHDASGALFVFHASGPSGARILGRFCHADERIHQLVSHHLAEEEALAPGARFFEVVHLPEGRIGNVVCRPVLRDYEVEYLGRSGAARDRVLPARDLLVSVVNGRLRLRSASLGCELIPRMTTAHNLRSSRIALYRFLGALQGYGQAEAMTWRWGVLDGLSFLPRVTVGGTVVLSRARWKLRGADVEALQAVGDPATRLAAVRAIVERRGLPRWAALAEADHELVVDLHAVTGAELLCGEAKGARDVTLIEVLDREGVATSPAGRHAVEVLVPMVRTSAADPPPPTPSPLGDNGRSIARDFVPGSEWLSLKLYCGAATADSVLREVVAPCVREVLDGAADRWFFLRYGDPEWHLRVRFHGAPKGLAAEVLPALHAAARPLVADGRISLIVADTYRREVERYGGPDGIELFEEFSAADSAAVLALVALTPGDRGLGRRWRLAAVGVDRLLGDLGFDVATRQRLVRSWRAGLVTELGAGWVRHAGTVHRREGRNLAQMLEGADVDGHEHEHEVFAQRSGLVLPLADRLRAAEGAGRLTESVERIASSYAHLHVNRMLRGAARIQELVLYDLLDRWYRAVTARSR